MSEQRTTKPHSTSESSERLKIILIGGRDLGGRESSGKSSTGNIILGREAFRVGTRTARSVKAAGEVHGRHVTVIDTPSWWWHYCVEDTPKFDRIEIEKSLTLCAPGPHIFLLVIPVDNMFPQDYRMALEEQLEFLSEKVWRHIIVLFSSIAPYDDRAFKNNFRNWPDLRMLVKKCQNRCHVLNIKDRDDQSQVITLLEKIEEVVAQNDYNYFKISKSMSIGNARETDTKERVKKKILAVKRQRAALQAQIKDEEFHLTDIQIILLGASWAARSSAGNLILGEDVFQTSESKATVCCEIKYAEVQGRQLTVVDTPGWFYNRALEKSSEIDKLEIRRSVCLCQPGPHAILLTVPVATAFNDAYRRAVEEHMSLLGKKVWDHTIVLFTRGDWLGDTTIEERIEEEGERFEWLMEQCGYRYHVFDCKNHSDTTQVTELLQKIEEMVMKNKGCHYVSDEKSNPSTELELNLKQAKINTKKRHRQNVILQELLKERTKKLSEVRIVLLGGARVGKSLLGNLILEGSFFDTALVEGLKPQPRTRQCLMKQRKVEGCQVSVVDTPGWSESSLENLKEISQSVMLCSPGPHVFLLVLPVDKSFTKQDKKTTLELMSIFGERVWRHTLIVFSGYWLKDRPVEEYIACEGEALQSIIRKCGNRYHVLAQHSDFKNLLKMIEETVARNRGEYFTQKTENMSLVQMFKSQVPTEKEWNEREDKLIERMLEAAVLDIDEDSKQPSGRRRESLDHAIPSMSGDSQFENSRDAFFRVSQWLLHPGNYAASSGYDTMSITSSSQQSQMESIKDNTPLLQNDPSNMKTSQIARNMRKQIKRSLSI